MKYYGIPVPAGKKLTEGVVPQTCEAAGMRAVCPGNSNCKYYSSRCDVVPLELNVTKCGSPMRGLARKVCGGSSSPSTCPQLEGLFSYYKGWSGGDCGAVNGKACVKGNEYKSGKYNVYYAYCVKG